MFSQHLPAERDLNAILPLDFIAKLEVFSSYNRKLLCQIVGFYIRSFENLGIRHLDRNRLPTDVEPEVSQCSN
jgi:hypothetical protein